MLSSQLGRIVLSSSASTTDEMTARPGCDGSYGPIDTVIGEVADRLEKTPAEESRLPADDPLFD